MPSKLLLAISVKNFSCEGRMILLQSSFRAQTAEGNDKMCFSYASRELLSNIL